MTDSNNPRDFISNSFKHTVLLLHNNEAEQLTQKTVNKSLISLFEEHNITKPPTGTLRFCSSGDYLRLHSGKLDTYIDITKLSLRWVDKDYYSKDPTRFQFRVLQPTTPHYFPPIKTVEDVKQFRANYYSEKEPFVVPWFNEYRKQYFSYIRRVPFEYFGYPTACILATTSSDPDPLTTLEKMKEDMVFPRYIDSSCIIYAYVILYDDSTPIERSQEAISKIQRANKNAYLVSLKDSDTIINISQFVLSFVWSAMIPTMEKIVQQHYEEVTKARSGIKHKWALFRGAKFGSSKSDKDGMMFDPSSLEYRERRLADWCFMLGDFATALKTYKSLSDIYGNENATAYKASALEMAGNCILMGNNSTTIKNQTWHDAEKLFEESIVVYSKSGMRSWYRRVLLTLGIWAQFYNQTRSVSSYKKLLSIPNIDPVEKALLYQQSAISFLLQNQPRLRSYAFDLTLSANLFLECGHKLHALVSYLGANHVYKGKGWCSINDTINSNIVKLAMSYDDLLDIAMDFAYNLLYENDQDPETQNDNCLTYLDLIKTRSGGGNIFPIPHLIGNPKFHLYDHYDSVDNEWSTLENTLIECSRERESFVWFKKSSKIKEKVGATGEMITIEFRVRNGLKVPLDLKAVETYCEIDIEPSPSGASSVSGNKLEVETQDISLPPLQDTFIRLKLTPMVEGILTIKGIKFNFGGLDVCKPLSSDYPVIKITSPMPLIETQITGFTEHGMFVGGIYPLSLRIKNIGSKPLENLNLISSHPHCLVSPLLKDEIKYGPIKSWTSKILDKTLENEEDSTVEKSKKVILDKDEEITLPLWIRPPQKGKTQWKLLVYYRPVNGNPDIKHRVHRIPLEFDVNPSLRTKMKVLHDNSDNGDYIMNLELHNISRSSKNSAKLHNIQFMSNRWQISNLNNNCAILDDYRNSIEARSHLSMYYSITELKSRQENAISRIEVVNTNELSELSQTFLTRELTLNRYKEPGNNDLLVEDPESKRDNQDQLSHLTLSILMTTPHGDHKITVNILNVSWLPSTPWNGDSACPIRIEINYPKAIAHDFIKDPLCITDVVFRVVNYSQVTALDCELKIYDIDELNDGYRGIGYYWVGKTKHEPFTIHPNSFHDFLVQACFTEPGRFLVGGYKFVVNPKEKSHLQFDASSPLQNVITIKPEQYADVINQ